MKNAQTAIPSTQSPGGSQPFMENLDVRIVVFSLRDERLQVLLVSCASVQTGSRWELPGSLVPINQSLEETATESVLRLTGLREVYLEQLYTYGDAGRSTGRRLVSVIYFAIVPAGAVSQHINIDECQASWFPVEELPVLVMDHREVAAYALRRLRYKLEYTAVGFQLLPEHFSLSELQKMYEIILGEKLDKRNFRRRILQAGIIEETDHLRSGEGRPARLYRYRPDAVAEVKVRRLFP
jgi:8-oxo-dGTP diphosphatase